MTEIIYTIESIDAIFKDLKKRYTELLRQGILETDYDYVAALANEKIMALKFLNRGAHGTIFSLIDALNKNLDSHDVDSD